jgi:hypothetical protein
MTLRRLVLDFTREGIEIRTLYRTQGEAGPSTKVRRREVTELTREGLSTALEALEGRVDTVGTSGYGVREDVLVATASPNADKLVKKA